MENYLMLNGKRIDLTAEQIETLVGKKEKDPFERVAYGEIYSYINSLGQVVPTHYGDDQLDGGRYDVANACTDKELFEQRALHVILNQQLWRYSMQHGGREIDWSSVAQPKYTIYQNDMGVWLLDYDVVCARLGVVYFHTNEVAYAAIEEIVKPFMEQHPEFRW